MLTSETVRAILTKTQYKYWCAYYYEDMTLAEISEKYNVHITSVSHVLTNARKRFTAYERGFRNG